VISIALTRILTCMALVTVAEHMPCPITVNLWSKSDAAAISRGDIIVWTSCGDFCDT